MMMLAVAGYFIMYAANRGSVSSYWYTVWKYLRQRKILIKTERIKMPSKRPKVV